MQLELRLSEDLPRWRKTLLERHARSAGMKLRYFTERSVKEMSSTGRRNMKFRV